MFESLVLLIMLLPIALILVVANLAQRARAAGQSGDGLAIGTWLLLGGLHGALMVAGVGLLLFQSASAVGVGLDGTPLPPLLGPETVASPRLLILSLIVPPLLGLIVLLPPVRRLAARVLPLDAGNVVHGAALSLSLLVILSMGATLGVGLGTMLETATAVGTAAVWGQAVLFVLLAMVGVGWLVRRDTRDTLTRLGIVVPTGRQVVLGVGLAVVMVFVVMAASAAAATVGLGVDADVEELTEQLLGGLTQSLFGIVTLGMAAALGEEALMRGAAQPRLGIVYTSLLFALLHSNYGISFSTVIVFGLGLVLGWVRVRHNTSTAMILHAVYNGLLGLMAYFSIEWLQ